MQIVVNYKYTINISQKGHTKMKNIFQKSILQVLILSEISLEEQKVCSLKPAGSQSTFGIGEYVSQKVNMWSIRMTVCN